MGKPKKEFLGNLEGAVIGNDTKSLIIGVGIAFVVLTMVVLMVGYINQLAHDMINETENPEVEENLDTLNDAIPTVVKLVIFVIVVGILAYILSKIGLLSGGNSNQ